MIQMIKETTIIVRKKIKARNPVLIVGLPGIGNVGKLVAEHLRREFDAERIATVVSPHFPHTVIMLKNGGVRLSGNRFYLLKNNGAKRDIILLTGDTQAVTPEGQYEVNQKIVEFFKNELGGSFIYTLGGYSVANSIVTSPRVFGNVTRKTIMKQFKDSGVVFGKSRGMIWGSAGLIIAFAQMQKLDGICLMGETSFLDIDAAAAKAVIKVLAAKLDLKIDTKNLDKIIDKTAKAIKELERQASGFASQSGHGADEQRPSYIR